ncbi:hypothetical protein SHIRM173S_03923 [Streptomyces hirsutus]
MGAASVPGPKLTDPVAVIPAVVPVKAHTAPDLLLSPGAETTTCPTTAVPAPKRSPSSADPGTPAVFWLEASPNRR